jgi:hypothetical protein
MKPDATPDAMPDASSMRNATLNTATIVLSAAAAAVAVATAGRPLAIASSVGWVSPSERLSAAPSLTLVRAASSESVAQERPDEGRGIKLDRRDRVAISVVEFELLAEHEAGEQIDA